MTDDDDIRDIHFRVMVLETEFENLQDQIDALKAWRDALEEGSRQMLLDKDPAQ